MKLRIAGLFVALILLATGVAWAAEGVPEPAKVAFAGLEWTPFNDTWQVTEAGMTNGGTDSTNTNIYTAIDQKGNLLTYTWTIAFGTTTSDTSGPMAGMHILGNNPTDVYRGSSLMIWQDKNNLRVYNSVDGKVPSGYRYDFTGVTAAAGETHTYKAVVDGKSGELTLSRDGQLVGSWVPVAPLTQGSIVSMRTNRTIATFKEFSFSAQ